VAIEGELLGKEVAPKKDENIFCFMSCSNLPSPIFLLLTHTPFLFLFVGTASISLNSKEAD
jgi:hypothetical protein